VPFLHSIVINCERERERGEGKNKKEGRKGERGRERWERGRERVCEGMCVCVSVFQMGGGGGNLTIFTEFSTQLSEMFMILKQRTNLAISLPF